MEDEKAINKDDRKLKKMENTMELNHYFEEALKHPHTRLEYIRKGKGKTKPKQKQGVMIACIDPIDNDKVIIGFSLCHLGEDYDKFDYLNCGLERKTDFGKMVAHRRAMKYATSGNAMIYGWPLDVKAPGTVYIPQTVHENLEKFVLGAYKYYKDKEFPAWVLRIYPKPVEEKPEEKGEE